MSSKTPVARLTLAYRDLTEINPKVVEKFGATLKELDLSNNRLRDALNLRGMEKLETLVVDNNLFTSNSKFPPLPALKTLWINRNKITNLAMFIDRLTESIPHLEYLSMLKNDACPNFFNGGTLKQYNDYRLYVISRLKSLTQLDSSPVMEEERIKAKELYGSLSSVTQFSEKEKEREAKALLRRIEEKRKREAAERELRRAERIKQRIEKSQSQASVNTSDEPQSSSQSTSPSTAKALTELAVSQSAPVVQLEILPLPLSSQSEVAKQSDSSKNFIQGFSYIKPGNLPLPTAVTKKGINDRLSNQVDDEWDDDNEDIWSSDEDSAHSLQPLGVNFDQLNLPSLTPSSNSLYWDEEWDE